MTADGSAGGTDGDGTADPGFAPIAATRGALTFLTRIPVPGGGPADWEAFRRSPWTFPAVGLVVGAVAGSAFLLPVPAPTAVAGYLLAVYLLTGVTHADGLADLGDAIAAHDPERRRAVLKDSDLGVGGALALAVSLLVTTLGALALATLAESATGPAGGAAVAFRVALAAEVGAKTGMALSVCFGEPAHEGIGSQLVGAVGPLAAVPALVVAGLVLLAPPPGALPALLAALLAGPVVAGAVHLRVRRWLGGVSGDVLGASNELGRAVALNAGVIACTLP